MFVEGAQANVFIPLNCLRTIFIYTDFFLKTIVCVDDKNIG